MWEPCERIAATTPFRSPLQMLMESPVLQHLLLHLLLLHLVSSEERSYSTSLAAPVRELHQLIVGEVTERFRKICCVGVFVLLRMAKFNSQRGSVDPV